MRKYPLLLLALILAFTVPAVLAVAALDAPKDQIAFTEQVLCGDPSAASGLTVRLDTQYRYYLRWRSDITFSPTCYTAQTAYTFENGRYWDNDASEPCDLYITDGISSSLDFEDENPLSAAMQALKDKVQPGTAASSILRVADYYETYPLEINIVLPNLFYGTQVAYLYGPEQDAIDRLNAFFQIPVLPDQYLQIEVEKSVDGGQSVGISSAEQGDSFNFYTQSIATADAFYFFFDNKTVNGQYIDTSRIPGGYGLYCLPYGQVDTEKPYKGQPDGWQGYDVFADCLTCLYPVSPDTTLTHLAASADGTRLFLHTVEDGVYNILVLDAKTGALLQRCPLLPFDAESAWADRVDGQDFQLVRFDDQFFLYALQPDGTLRQALHVMLSEQERSETFFPWYSTQNRAFAWQDGRLAVVCSERHSSAVKPYSSSLDCGFTVAIYAEDALQYYGLYPSSLDAANATGDLSPAYNTPISCTLAP